MTVMLKKQNEKSQSGGAALEYVLVTAFAAITGIAALGIASSIIKDKLEQLSEKLELHLEDIDINPFDNG
ncbi:MAG: hypothetical protein R3B45_04785 [Bdellovibrionota bacterium]